MQKEKTLNLALKAPYIGILGNFEFFKMQNFFEHNLEPKISCLVIFGVQL